jgi:Ca-activated chloride channel family protein
MKDAGTERALPILGDEEVARRPADDEPGAGTLVTERGNLPLEALSVHARITGLLAEVVITQTFVNRFDLPLEATYVFPLPDRAAVTEFRMEAGDRVVEGTLRERAEARAAYDQAIAGGRMAAITEEERPGVFTMRVGNLPPGERASVRLVMLGPLPYDQGEVTFRFPLVVAPRYIPGTPLGWPPAGDGVQQDTDAVPDASRITPPVLLPGFPSPVRLDLEAEIDPAGLSLGDLRSSLHAIVVSEHQGSGGRVRVVKVEPGERPDRDFVLRLQVGSGALATSALAVPDERGDGGTFVLTVVPPTAEAERPRDVALVLDRSGSMAGWKIVAARRAAARLVDSLCERDRLTLLAFSSTVQHPPGMDNGAPRQATDRERFRAVEFLARLDAHGGTEMAAPLLMALDRLGGQDRPCGLAPATPAWAPATVPAGVTSSLSANPGERGRDRILVLVTDGQVGNEDQILALLAPRLAGIRVYTVGIDTAVNEGFLRRLAIAGGGACELVESEDRLDEALDRVRQRIGTPVVTDPELHADGLGVEPGSVTPPRLPALLAGAPLVVCGRYRGRPRGTLALRGQAAGGERWSATVPVVPAANKALAKVWARAHVRDLEDRYATGATHDADLERRIVRTSLGFGVLSRFTAFVALDTVVMVNRDGRLHRVTQPVDVPRGWEWPPHEPAPVSIPFAGRGGLLSVQEAAPLGIAPPPPSSRPHLRRAVARPERRVAPVPPDAKTGQGRRFWRALPAQAGPPDHKGSAATGMHMEQPVASLDAYRRRAGELARELEAVPEPALGGRLVAMAAKVAALVADLESVGVDPRILEPLRDLVAALIYPGERPRGLRDRAATTLRKFAEEGP